MSQIVCQHYIWLFSLCSSSTETCLSSMTHMRWRRISELAHIPSADAAYRKAQAWTMQWRWETSHIKPTHWLVAFNEAVSHHTEHFSKLIEKKAFETIPFVLFSINYFNSRLQGSIHFKSIFGLLKDNLILPLNTIHFLDIVIYLSLFFLFRSSIKLNGIQRRRWKFCYAMDSIQI